MAHDLGAAQFAAIFDAVPVALLVMEPDLRMVTANKAYLDTVGLHHEEIAGHYVAELFPDAPDRDGINQLEALYDFMRSTVAGGVAQTLTNYRYDIPNRDGGFDERFWNVTEVPVVVDGGVRYLLHYTEDITDLVVEREAREAAAAANDELQRQVAAAQVDLLRRAEDLEALNQRLQFASARDRSAAVTLQEALLTRLPQVARLELASLYRTAAEHDQVGGDWYDAIDLGGGRVAVAIGDVMGHDITAAATMGQLRSILRAFAWEHGQPPSMIMTQLDRAMRDLDIRVPASVVLANIEPAALGPGAGCDASSVTWTNAGHPAPIMVTRDGTTSLLAAAGGADLLLGVDADLRERRDHRIDVPAGATVLFFTDGLIETREASLDDGISVLRAALVRYRDLPLAELLDAVVDDLVGSHPQDDVAVLAVRNAAAAARGVVSRSAPMAPRAR